jgi:hypothetical protein
LFHSKIRSVSFEIAYRVTVTNQFHLNNIPKQATLLLSSACIEFWYCSSFVALLDFLSLPIAQEELGFLATDNHRHVIYSNYKNALLKGVKDIENIQNITNYTSVYILAFLHIRFFTHLRTISISLQTKISIFHLILLSCGKITRTEKSSSKYNMKIKKKWICLKLYILYF